jgi:hypothetical protein
MAELGSNPGSRGRKPATNRLSYSTDFLIPYFNLRIAVIPTRDGDILE